MGRSLDHNRWRNSCNHLHMDHSRNPLHLENPIHRTWAKAWKTSRCLLFFQTLTYTARAYTKAYNSTVIIAASIAVTPFRVMLPSLQAECSCIQGMCIPDRGFGFPASFRLQSCLCLLRKREEWLRFSSQHTPFFWSQQPMHIAGVANLADFPAALLGGRQNLSLYGNP